MSEKSTVGSRPYDPEKYFFLNFNGNSKAELFKLVYSSIIKFWYKLDQNVCSITVAERKHESSALGLANILRKEFLAKWSNTKQFPLPKISKKGVTPQPYRRVPIYLESQLLKNFP